MTTAAQSPRLDAMNSRLERLGFNPLTLDQARRLLEFDTPDSIHAALEDADKIAAAYEHVTKLLAKVQSLPPPHEAAVRRATPPQHARAASHPDRSRFPQHRDRAMHRNPSRRMAAASEAPIDDNPAEPQEGAASASDVAGDAEMRVRVYGRNGALLFEPRTYVREDKPARHVVMVDAAKSRPGAQREYEWGSKIVFMLSPDELAELLCVTLGTLPSIRFSAHGPAKDKWMSVEHQGTHLFLKIGEGKDREAVATQIPARETFRLAGLLTRQIQRNLGGIDSAGVLQLAMRVVSTMTPQQQAGNSGQGSQRGSAAERRGPGQRQG